MLLQTTSCPARRFDRSGGRPNQVAATDKPRRGSGLVRICRAGRDGGIECKMSATSQVGERAQGERRALPGDGGVIEKVGGRSQLDGAAVRSALQQTARKRRVVMKDADGCRREIDQRARICTGIIKVRWGGRRQRRRCGGGQWTAIKAWWQSIACVPCRRTGTEFGLAARLLTARCTPVDPSPSGGQPKA